MVATAAQISVVLSGGSVNTDPSLSIGGSPSDTPVNFSHILGNLFDDVTPTESGEGHEDYRCIYIFNDAEDAVYDVTLWVTSEVSDGASISLGIESQDDFQRISVTGNPTGGFIEVTYGGETYVSNYNSDLSAWATALETGLNALEDDDGNALLTGVSVNAQNTSTGIVFDIQFGDYDGKRIQDALGLNSSLTPGSVSVSLSSLQSGSPINTIAPTIDVDTTPPGNVVFFVPSEETPIVIPRLEPTEGFPLWFHRTVEAGATAVADDGFSMKLRMSGLRP